MALTHIKSIFSKINTLPIPFLQQAPLTRQQKLISHVSKILDAVAKPEIIIGCAFATLLAFCTLQIENSKPEVIKIKTRYANHKIEKGSIVFTETKYQIMQ
jgi:mitochondrial fission protein ELM1